MAFYPDNFEDPKLRRTQLLMIAWIIWSLVFVSCFSLRFIRWVRTELSLSIFFSDLQRMVKQIRCLSGDTLGPLDSQILDAFNRERLALSRTVVRMTIGYIFVMTLQILSSLDANTPRSMSTAQDIGYFILAFGVLVVWVFPQTVTLRTIDICYSMAMLSLCNYMSPWALKSDLVSENIATAFVTTMLLGLFNINPKLNIFWSLMVAVSGSATYTIGEKSSCFYTKDGSYVQELFLYAVGVSIFVITIQRTLFACVRSEVEALQSGNELKAASSILASVCDIVVELDSNLRLRMHYPRLSNMLMLNPQRDLTSERLEDFMCNEGDCEKYLEQMRGEQPLGIANAFHVRMRDSAGITLSVELFCVRFSPLGPGADIRHLVGVREFNDATFTAATVTRPRLPSKGQVRQRACVNPTEQGFADEQTTEQVVDELHASSSDNGSHPGCATASDGSCTSSEQSDQPTDEATVAINILSPNYDVVRYSSAFASLCNGEPHKTSLLSWVSKSDRKHFRKWMQQAYEKLTGIIPGEGILFTRQVIFQPPKFLVCRVKILVTVEIVQREGNSESMETDDECIIADLVFHDVQWIVNNRGNRKALASGTKPKQAFVNLGGSEPLSL